MSIGVYFYPAILAILAIEISIAIAYNLIYSIYIRYNWEKRCGVPKIGTFDRYRWNVGHPKLKNYIENNLFLSMSEIEKLASEENSSHYDFVFDSYSKDYKAVDVTFMFDAIYYCGYKYFMGKYPTG